MICLSVLLILIVLLFVFLHKKDNKLKPYVIEKNIEIVSAKEEFKIPFKPYAKDTNKLPVDIAGVKFEDAIGTYNFYDYSVNEVDNNYAIYSFKYDLVLPIKYTVDTTKEIPKFSRSYALLNANVFDYYTGELYAEKNVSVKGNVNYNDIKTIEEEFAFTNITWDGKTYKIGVRNEASSSWAGIKKVEEKDGIITYTDTNKVTMTTYIYAPKDYDGLMVSLNKNGTSKDMVLKQIEFNNKYNKLLSDSQETGKKSDELLEIENKINKLYKLLDKREDVFTIINSKDDFYVMRVNDIKK